MGFKEDLLKLSVQVTERKDHIINEEMAKHSLIVPFLQVLGYDVFNPLEVRPEYDADFGKKKGEKVDYAVFKDGSPIIFIEAKSLSEKLENHDSQLARYFNATPEVKVGIITNGVKYKFFTDLNNNNIMDDKPFLEICITDLSDMDIDNLVKLRKECFSTSDVVMFAEELIYTSNLNSKLEEIFRNPPDDFVRYLIKDFSDTRITANVIERFRPIVKKSISQALLNMVSQGLASQNDESDIIQIPEVAAVVETEKAQRKTEVETTEDEKKAYEIIKSILDEQGRDTHLLGYKDTVNYLGIYYKNPSNWLMRLTLEGNKRNVTTNIPLAQARSLIIGLPVEEAPKGAGISRVMIKGVGDIALLKDLIIACYDDIVRN